MTENYVEAPKRFHFFCGLCILLGAGGILLNGKSLIADFAPELLPKLKGDSNGPWLTSWNLACDGALLVGGFYVGKHKVWARQMLVIVATANLIELIFNAAMSLSKGDYGPSIMFFIIIMAIGLIPQGSIIWYFTRKSVTRFVMSSSL